MQLAIGRGEPAMPALMMPTEQTAKIARSVYHQVNDGENRWPAIQAVLRLVAEPLDKEVGAARIIYERAMVHGHSVKDSLMIALQWFVRERNAGVPGLVPVA